MANPMFVGVIGTPNYPCGEQVPEFLISLPDEAVVILPNCGSPFNIFVKDWLTLNERPYDLLWAGIGGLYFEPDDQYIAEKLLRLSDEVFAFRAAEGSESMTPEFDRTCIKTFNHTLKRSTEWGKLSNIFEPGQKASY